MKTADMVYVTTEFLRFIFISGRRSFYVILILDRSIDKIDR